MLTALWQRLDRDPPLFFDEQLEPAFGRTRDQVFAAGLLRQTTPSRSVSCRECGLGHVGRIEWLPNARTGGRDPFAPCPVCGPVRVDLDSLRQWLIDVPCLLGGVRTAGRFNGILTEVVAGHLWHLGNATWCRRSREAYFVRCVHDGNRARVTTALATHPKAVLCFPTEEAAHRWGAATGNVAVALESVVSLGSEGLAFKADLVEDRLEDARPSTPEPRPAPKRATRAANIARLTEEMVTHLRSARAHALATRALSENGEPKLLERPTKTLLGELAGLDPSDVTRCFDDETARELNLYWEMSLDLDAVMRFSGPVSAGSSE